MTPPLAAAHVSSGGMMPSSSTIMTKQCGETSEHGTLDPAALTMRVHPRRGMPKRCTLRPGVAMAEQMMGNRAAGCPIGRKIALSTKKSLFHDVDHLLRFLRLEALALLTAASIFPIRIQLDHLFLLALLIVFELPATPQTTQLHRRQP
jgi:hypothetical protein